MWRASTPFFLTLSVTALLMTGPPPASGDPGDRGIASSVRLCQNRPPRHFSGRAPVRRMIGRKVIVGRREWAGVENGKLYFNAKSDTGAVMTVVHADSYFLFYRDHGHRRRRWVSFTSTGDRGNTRTMVAPLERMKNFTRITGRQYRTPVIRLRICYGGVSRRVEVSLLDRSKMGIKMLVGRNFMAGRIVVDPTLKYTQPTPPRCSGSR